MKNVLKKSRMAGITLMIVVSLSTGVYASKWDNGGVNAYIEEITALQDGEFYVKFDRDICDGDLNTIGQVLVGEDKSGIQYSTEGAGRMLQVALAAKLSGKMVRVYANDSGPDYGCKMGALKIMD